MLQACHHHPMANLQVKNVPDELHERLRWHARRQGRTLRDVVLEAVRRELDHEEFVARLRSREPVDPGLPAGAVLEAIREGREAELTS